MPITPLYAAALALLFVFLSFRTLGLRRQRGIAIGDDNDLALKRAVRAHGNFIEYVPIALLLMYFMEIQDASLIWIHGCGIALLAGRLIHAYGLSQINEDFKFRVTGMVLTLTTIISGATRLLLAPVL